MTNFATDQRVQRAIEQAQSDIARTLRRLEGETGLPIETVCLSDTDLTSLTGAYSRSIRSVVITVCVPQVLSDWGDF